MLIRISGGKKGISEYLVTGRKAGRSKTRVELDERIILHGDLEFLDQVIEGMNTKGEKYLHITLSFKENLIDIDTLREISEEFRQFAFRAYNDDEYVFYSEVHFPKTKTIQNQKSGKYDERKPHIHIVIPKINLLSWTTLNPFGMLRLSSQYIDAFQEYINSKYNVESPKDNRRINFDGRSDMNSRYTGDFFNGSSKDQKRKILRSIIEQNISSKSEFQDYLNSIGQVRIRNEGKENEYFNIILPNATRGINLKEIVFREDFLKLSKEEKQRKISFNPSDNHSISEKMDRVIDSEQLLTEWQQLKCKEIKYLNSGNRVLWRQYQNGSDSEKAQLISDLETVFYKKYKENELAQPYQFSEQQAVSGVEKDIQLESLNRTDTLQQQLYQFNEAKKLNELERVYSEKKCDEEFVANILAIVVKNYDVRSDSYEIRKRSNNTIEIQSGDSSYSCFSFLKEYMHLDSETIERFLQSSIEQKKESYAIYANNIPEPELNLWRRFALERNEYYEWKRSERKRLYEKRRIDIQNNREQYRRSKSSIYDTIGNRPHRKAQLSILQMNYVQKQKVTWDSTRLQIDPIIERQKSDYKKWLTTAAEKGDTEALEELRRINPFKIRTVFSSDIMSIQAAESYPNKNTFIPYDYRIDDYGNVTYSLNNRDILRDRGKTIDLLQSDSQTIEEGIRLAMLKFGSCLKLIGTDNFKRDAALTVRRLKIPVRFTEKWVNEIIQHGVTH